MDIERISSLPTFHPYSDLEYQKLIEFRAKVQNLLQTEYQKDDSFLIRWLRARDLNLIRAEEMLRASLKWRQDNDVDNILKCDDIPEEVKKMSPVAYSGISTEGYATFVVPFGRNTRPTRDMDIERISSLPTFHPYSDLEYQKLIEFRAKVQNLLQTEYQKDDSFLIRWLRARDLNLIRAEEMLRASLKWRQDNDVDNILKCDDIPEEVKKMSPVAYSGISTEGYATFVVPFGRFSYRQMSSKPCRELMAKVQQQTDSNYPELLRYAMVVNAPKIFATLLAMFKPFIAKSTLDKIDIYGPDPEIWKAVVKQKFTVENIPPHWGGSLQGVDEFCSGGEIWIHGPKDMRSVMHAIAKFLVALSKSATAQTYELTLQGLTEADADFHKIIVNAREKFVKTVQLSEKNTIPEWKFKKEKHDIAFQLTVVPDSNIAFTCLK
ncbi:SEC14-like protein 3 [Folsomia candida]|uniref:SEC14-like protein 3 n=1 Tax=Folsomia candida TaxID=158441 RepID=UPI000B8F0AF0|nr:SEC14-like protein 3 [Folsomia candida]